MIFLMGSVLNWACYGSFWGSCLLTDVLDEFEVQVHLFFRIYEFKDVGWC
jgi:hypothetical protein